MLSHRASDRSRLSGLIVLVLSGLFAMCTLTACNTTKGVGQDIEALGEEIEDAAD